MVLPRFQTTDIDQDDITLGKPEFRASEMTGVHRLWDPMPHNNRSFRMEFALHLECVPLPFRIVDYYVDALDDLALQIPYPLRRLLICELALVAQFDGLAGGEQCRQGHDRGTVGGRSCLERRFRAEWVNGDNGRILRGCELP